MALSIHPVVGVHSMGGEGGTSGYIRALWGSFDGGLGWISKVSLVKPRL